MTRFLGSSVARFLGEHGSRLPRIRGTESPRCLVVITLLILLTAQSASACPVCYGDPGDPMVKATNNGVWVMLGIIAFVQIGFAAMFLSFRRRMRQQKRFREQFHVIEGGPLS